MNKTLLDILADWLELAAIPPFVKGGMGHFNLNIIVAFSGGRDSTVLLHSLNHLKKISKKSFSLEAWHVNHQLQADASAWVKHCADFCLEHEIPLQSFAVSIEQKKGESLEAVARTARYQVFLDNIISNSILVTAHHQQDNVETFLHHALRGAGVRGLRGIAPWKPFGDQSFLARPLLEVSTEQIAEYALAQGLHWISDPSNQNQRFSRNFIRHEVLPVMTQYYSAAVACVSRTIRHCREAEELLEILAQQDLAEMEIKTPYGNALSVEIFLRKTIAQQKNVLRVWLKIQNILPPEDSRLSEFLRQLREAKADKHPTLPCGEWILTIYQSHIYTYSPAALEAMKKSSDSNPGGKSIKKRLQALKIPPWMRKIVTI